MVADGGTRSVAFDVVLNACRVCVAGLGGRRGVVSTIVHWTDREGEVMLQVGGLDTESRESLGWAKKHLTIGDELVIRVVENVAITRVRSRELRNEQFESKQEKAWLRATAKRYGYRLVRRTNAQVSR